MKQRDQSPIDGIADQDEPTSLNLNAVVAMVRFFELDYADFENLLDEKRRFYFENGIDYPDWLIAGLNCKDDEMILPICIHSYLMDWKAPK